jgi:chromosome partitioning protein
MPKVIAVCNPKGGAGKTTIIAALAVSAPGGAVVIDADPQGSLSLWWERRGQHDFECITATEEKSLTKAVAKERAGKADWVLIDTPPAVIEQIEAAVMASDYVVVPVRASIFDIEPISIIGELAALYSKPFGLVVNAADKDWANVEQTENALADFGTLLGKIRYHERHAVAATVGQTAAEYEGRKVTDKKEIDAIWSAIKSHMPKRGRT